MRFCCELNLFILFFFCSPAALTAQVAPDTIPAGVIVVHRPPVKAAFYVQQTVLGGKLNDRSFGAPNDSTAFDGSPHPNMPENMEFSWRDVLSQTKYEYEWKDSTRSDSARFIYTVDKQGKAKCESFPYAGADSAGLAFQEQAYKYLVLLDNWKPARAVTGVKRDGSGYKSKRVPCTVIIIVHAYDPNVGRLVPLGPER